MANSLIDIPDISKRILDRKCEYIFHGFHELDFPFPEISGTFNDVKNTIHKQLNELNEKLSQIPKDGSFHQRYYAKALEHIKENLLFVDNKLTALIEGVDVFQKKDSDEIATRVKMKLPYGECIRVCAQYAEINDLYYRAKNRFEQFGPDKPYYDDAVLNQSLEGKQFRDYIGLLERQDYITAFNKIRDNTTSDADKWLLEKAKANNYEFTDRTILLKTVSKEMSVPFPFQTPRYKHHLEEDLLYHDVILFPTMKALEIDHFKNTRPYNVYYLGLIEDSIFADEFNLTAGDFFYHDAKHTFDMISRNWVAYLEQELSLSESHNLFLKTRRELDTNIQTQITALNSPYEQELKRAINITMFELNHEEGYPYDYNSMIRALESPNPFYGQKMIDFLIEKLTSIYFFFPEKSNPEEIFQFPVEMLEVAKHVILTALYECRELAKKQGYKDNSDIGYWEITRGKTQINPYQVLSGEQDYQSSSKTIGNLSLLFKPTPKAPKDISVNDVTNDENKKHKPQ